ncbi:MAG: hypothetical protein B7X65_08570 [Polaromonas sp. 39-63-25]|nr:MAG: hypothetical protein B7Y60_01060 [Polaromonas sp. 35-63-35]OYZ22541.1 MAG: hypothetical protein B7Y28_01060 [Polaromonas sp. 16-63-31]OYZ81243.1 MAG: hypothetical protein B7Y09_02095 [Polaromonas sp. 24-63-21]OZA52536.1 MAG: hypothetical protein B7X88_01055 [Polaromonas sp. 17-63-33]OZA88604.1 MAG: hypothetical protein B7X65_08570 [Polaromonas sp. 39-63-25]
MSKNMTNTPPIIQLMQLNNNYGNQYYLPYSIGVLAAYVKKNQKLKEAFKFNPFLYKRAAVEEIVEAIGFVDVFGVSAYTWNWELSVRVAQRIREVNPDALIIFGGPHVPDSSPEFFDQYGFIDIAVHGEGEMIFDEILTKYLSKECFREVPGISFNDRKNGEVITNKKPSRMKDYAELPSPYLEGEFDALVADNPEVEWMAPWETNRGCPFQCTFCDWGSSIASKVNEFPGDRIAQEIEWFSKNKIGYILGCDANFGIRKRDIDIATALVASKKNTGYPKDFAVCFTKNSTEAIFGVGKILHAGEMLKAVSISMQSLDEGALKSIKRDNIKLEVFKQLQSKYNEAGITTFTELILGLPGESRDSFAKGICTLLDNGQHSQIYIYNCSIMPNAEMGGKVYQDMFRIKTVAIPIFTAHSKKDDSDAIVEYDRIIVETDTMDKGDWRAMHHFAWIIQCFHMLGLFQGAAIFLRNYAKVSYHDIYSGLLQYAYANPESHIGQEIAILNGVLDGVLDGREYGQYLPEDSDVSWPAEEASFLRLSKRKDEVYAELHQFTLELLAQKETPVNADIVKALLNYQKIVIANPHDVGDAEMVFEYDIPDFISAHRNGLTKELVERNVSYLIKRPYNFAGNLELFSRNIVWYGRKRGRLTYQHHAVTEDEELVA